MYPFRSCDRVAVIAVLGHGWIPAGDLDFEPKERLNLEVLNSCFSAKRLRVVPAIARPSRVFVVEPGILHILPLHGIEILVFVHLGIIKVRVLAPYESFCEILIPELSSFFFRDGLNTIVVVCTAVGQAAPVSLMGDGRIFAIDPVLPGHAGFQGSNFGLAPHKISLENARVAFLLGLRVLLGLALEPPNQRLVLDGICAGVSQLWNWGFLGQQSSGIHTLASSCSRSSRYAGC